MKSESYEDRLEWMAARRGKITGSRLKNIVSTGGLTKEQIVKELERQKVEFKKADKKEDLEKLLSPESRGAIAASLPDRKVGFYELIVERLGIPADDENPMERGSRLEAEGVARFEKESGREVDKSLVIWSREDQEGIAVSPDGFIGEEEAVECKCLAAARHLEAYLTKRIPDEYEHQVLQYFVVNDKLQTLHVVFYDPRFSMFVPPGSPVSRLDFFTIEVRREEVENKVRECVEFERRILAEVDSVIGYLTDSKVEREEAAQTKAAA